MSTDISTEDSPFVAYLVDLTARDDRAALAALRRGLGRPPGAAPEMYPHVARFFRDDERRDVRREDAMFTVAALFGMLPNHRKGAGSPLKVLREIGSDSPSTERRVLALLDAGEEGLPNHLRHLIALIDADPTTRALDYDELLYHLLQWDSTDRWVQRRWARDWWGGIRNDPTDAIDATDDDDTSEEGAD